MNNLFDVFENPAYRRCWLLAKALESAPLGEALALAKGAEAFLMGSADPSTTDVAAWHAAFLQLSTRVH